MERYENPDDPLNGQKYLTGKGCIEACGRPAGTAWSPLWCQSCNAERINRITRNLQMMVRTSSASKEAGKEGG